MTSDLPQLIIIGICAMLALAIGIIFFVILYQRRVISHQLELKKINEQKELELIQASIRSEEDERMRIAAELHDDVVATLASARLFLYKTKEALYDENVINQSKELLDQGIVRIRDISHKLQPASLQHLGLELSLRSLIETINKSAALSAAFNVNKQLPRTADNIELAIYRIVQELIANIIKHSAATAISLETDNTDQGLLILLTHNGQGMTQEMYESLIYKKGSTGLKNIVNRLKSINASIRFFFEPELGYKTELIIPLPTDSKQA